MIPPAEIIAYFENGGTIEIFIHNEESIFAVLKNEKEKIIGSRSQAQNFDFPEVNTLPQIGPLLKIEDKLESDYVKKNVSSSLSSLHFRNQLIEFPKFFRKFKELSEKTWKGLKLDKPEYKGTILNPKVPINLIFRDGDFSTEVGWVGQGLQMWLQTIWFLARCHEDSTIILDEPDVYLHADLQRKLIRILKNKYGQIIIATHSAEIISEVDPTNVLLLDKSKNKSSFAHEYKTVQKVIENMGSVHNLMLARLWSAKKFIIVEGKDINILKRIQDTLFPESKEPLESIPQMQCGGWSGWKFALGTNMGFKNSVGEDIIVYSIFDSDYHTKVTIAKRIEDAKKRNIQTHIWSKKEIENYLLIPTAILRIIEKKCTKNKETLSAVQIEKKLNEFCNELKENVIDNISDEYYLENKDKGIKEANVHARKRVEKSWDNLKNKLSIVSGKEILSLFSNWSKSFYGVSFNSINLASELRANEMDDELKAIVTRLEKRQEFYELLKD